MLVVWMEGTDEWENCGDGGLRVFGFLLSSPSSDHESSPYTTSVISDTSDLVINCSSSKREKDFDPGVGSCLFCCAALLGVFLRSLLRTLPTRNLVARIGPASIGVSIIAGASAGAVLSMVAVILRSSMTVSLVPQMVFQRSFFSIKNN
jgi:hypothetical protein